MNRQTLHEKVSLVAIGISIASLPYSIKICHAGLIILFLNWLIESDWSKKIAALRSNRSWIAWTLFFGLHLFSLLYTENTTQGWFSIEKKISILIVPALILSSSAIANHYKWLTAVFIASCTAGTIFCIGWGILHFNTNAVAVLQKIGLPSLEFVDANQTLSIIWLNFSYISLVSVIGISPTYFGLYLVTCVIMIGDIIYSNQKNTEITKVLLWCLVVYLSLFILLLNSRIITLSLLLVWSTLLVLLYQKEVKKIILIGSMMLIILIGIIYSNPINRFRAVEELRISSLTIKPHELYTNSISIRVSLWWLSEKVIAQINPWLGAGTGDVTDLIAQQAAHFDIKNILKTNDPHNQFIYTWIGVGVIGLIVFLVALLSPLLLYKQSLTFLYTSFIIVILITCLTESLMESQKGIVFLSIFQPLFINKFLSLS